MDTIEQGGDYMYKSLEQPSKLVSRGRAESPTPIAFHSLNDINLGANENNSNEKMKK